MHPILVNRQELLLWADTIAARGEFPRLLRRLIQETGHGVAQLGFPAGEGVSSGGWDGTVVTAEATPFIPVGQSVWELSTTKSAGTKVDEDYAKRASAPNGECLDTWTYVAAILRPWTKRLDWARDRTAEHKWKGVRALGVDDIETWLESAPVTHSWVSHLLGKNPYGLQAVDLWWAVWASATSPALSPPVVLSGRRDQQEALVARLKGPAQITTIKAGSLDEAKAFISAVILDASHGSDEHLLARSAFVDDLTTWRFLVTGVNELILIPVSDQTIADQVQVARHHVVVPLVDTASADIELPPIAPQEAAAELKEHGLEERAADKAAHLARRSLLAMRRSLAVRKELHQPTWASSPVDRSTRSLLFAGRWHDAVDGDHQVLSDLAGLPYDDFREIVVALANQPDPLVGRIGSGWSLVSTFDAWRLLASHVRFDDLRRVRPIVVSVMSEADPALDLPAKERWWRAAVEEQRPSYSGALRVGLATTLVLASINADRIDAGDGANGSDWASGVIYEIFQKANADLSCKIWMSLSDVLPLLAEATPDTFLLAVGQGLKGTPPLLAKMFLGDEDNGVFGARQPHSGLLWALEGVAWSDQHFGQAVDLLAQLAIIQPESKNGNKAKGSLAGILSPWHPENSVDPARRMAVLDGLRKRYPSIAWGLMRSMLPSMHAIHMPTHEPRYRSWKPAEVTATWGEYYAAVTGVANRLIEDASGNVDRWTELVDHIDKLPPTDRDNMLESLRRKIDLGTFSDDEKAKLWERLRTLTAQHRQFADAKWALPEGELGKVDILGCLLKPDLPSARHAWLFSGPRPDLPGVPRDDFARYDTTLGDLRKAAIAEVEAVGGYDALLEMALGAKEVRSVGFAIADASASKYETELFALIGTGNGAGATLASAYAARRFKQEGWIWIERTLEAQTELTPSQVAILLLETSDHPTSWERAAQIGDEVDREFWSRFLPYGLGADFAHVETAAGRLLGAGRNASTLDLIGLYIKRAGDATLALLKLALQALEALLVTPLQEHEIGVLGEYSLQQMFELLYEYRDELDREEIARLEWAYLPALGHEADPRMFGEMMVEDPRLFAELVSAIFRPDSANETMEVTPQMQNRATNAYRMLEQWSGSPGIGSDGAVNEAELATWFAGAVEALTAMDRLNIGMTKLGEVLARIPGAEDDWPGLPVRDLLEVNRSEELESGFYLAVINGRGVTTLSLGVGGEQERALAAKYGADASRFAEQWPRTAALLRTLATHYDREGRQEDDMAERFLQGLD